ncbi:MAG: transposase [Tepidisphaeraceae bacterium]
MFKANRQRTCRLEGVEFVSRFLQHILPKGFHKVRYYGAPARPRAAGASAAATATTRGASRRGARPGATAFPSLCSGLPALRLRRTAACPGDPPPAQPQPLTRPAHASPLRPLRTMLPERGRFSSAPSPASGRALAAIAGISGRQRLHSNVLQHSPGPPTPATAIAVQPNS